MDSTVNINLWINEKNTDRETIVKFFDTIKEVLLSTDESERVLSAFLSQDGHPRLTIVEINYSNIENIALAIVCNTDFENCY